MPVKRRIAKQRTHQITPEAIAAWRLANEIIDAGLDDVWEDQGGRRDEYIDARNRLDRALGLRPWEATPLDVADDGPPPAWMKSPASVADWYQAQEPRRQLIKAAGKG